MVENGELKALLHHSNSIEEKSGDQPHNEDLTEIKVPELNIDTKVVDSDGVKTILQHKRDVSTHHFNVTCYIALGYNA